MEDNKKSIINYKTYTSGFNKEWLVFFHGLGGNYTIFNKQIDIFKKYFNLLLIDLPGAW